MARDIQVTYDCADPARLAAFWADALGYRVQAPPEGFASWDDALEAFGVPPEHRNDASAVVDPQGAGPRLFFQRVPDTISRITDTIVQDMVTWQNRPLEAAWFPTILANQVVLLRRRRGAPRRPAVHRAARANL